jgi:hypothetical protein
MSGGPRQRFWFGAPPREWLAVLFLPVAAGVVIAELTHEILDADPPRTTLWLAFVLGLGGGLVAGLAYTFRLALGRRLFLRDTAGIARNRARIRSMGVPLGIAIAVIAALVTGATRIALLAAAAGASLGLEPGAVANFLRLRREEWLLVPDSDEHRRQRAQQ